MITGVRVVEYKGVNISYTLTIKKVKNVNLRIKHTGEVLVSAPARVTLSKIDEFVQSKGEFILNAIEEFKNKAETSGDIDEFKNLPDRQTCYDIFMEIVERVYPRFVPYGIEMPIVRVRTMKSRWGSCIPSKNVITLNTRLAVLSPDLIEYVVIHEFCHFKHQNHSKDFYKFVGVFCPDWKSKREEMSKIMIR